MIVITGASSGLGLAVARLYKAAGKKITNISRNECEYADRNILHDLSDGAELLAAAQEVASDEEPIEALINCIGVYNDQHFGEIEHEDVDRLLSTNAKAPMVLISELLDRIRADGTDILNVVSTAGVRGSKNNPVYVSSKWAERGFTQSLQDELSDSPSRVISFCPGGIDTMLFEKVGAQNDTSKYMDPSAVALFIKQVLDLPKNMQVTDIVIDRKRI